MKSLINVLRHCFKALAIVYCITCLGYGFIGCVTGDFNTLVLSFNSFFLYFFFGIFAIFVAFSIALIVYLLFFDDF